MGFNYNLLLEYLSYKKKGKWIDFKKYVNNLNYDDASEIKPGNIRRTLSALGHVEFDFSGEICEYIVAPPVISLLPNSHRGVLCGYRTEAFLKELEDNCKRLGIKFVREENFEAPDVIFINFYTRDLLENIINSKSLNISIVENFSLKILKLFPEFVEIINKSSYVDYEVKPVGKYEIYSKPAHFIKCSLFAYKENCVYETITFGRKKYYMYDVNVDAFKEVDKYIGIINQYANSSFCKLLIHKNNKLYIKKLGGLPELIDRALTLASGYNREFENQCLVYDNINLELVELLSRKSGLEFEDIKDV